MDECLKSEQATNPDAGKEGSVLNLGITMIPVCVRASSLLNTQKHSDTARRYQTHSQRQTLNLSEVQLHFISFFSYHSASNPKQTLIPLSYFKKTSPPLISLIVCWSKINEVV